MTCPNCGKVIDMNAPLISQFRDSVREDLITEFIKRERDLQNHQIEVNKLTEKLTKEKLEADEIIKNRVKAIIEARQEFYKESVWKKLSAENELKLAALKEKIEQESFLKLKEKEKIIDDLKIKIDEAKRKAEQGSMQLQGEVQELEILKMLQDFHPIDEIKQSKKGQNAADILQTIKTHNGAVCGQIYYESKRTKTWSNDWIPKLKKDNLKTKADVLVLVTNALPKEIKRYGIIDGVWVCTFTDVKELSLVLRYGILKVQSVLIKQNGRESKMEVLYDYMNSDDFKDTFDSIVNGFKSLQELFQREKESHLRQWKKTEQLYEQIFASSVNFTTKIRSISEPTAPLELPQAS